ncbi:BnaC04g52690D [Brassica napus]|uniref:(rape) hypothetical protein n=1 Tax=Brassica napus TaxID=3708 RepID=A0A078ILL4_BRANA|nr:unnamed protein product [Brassica napus]CDY50832.1 BnaC04g52690D [Brassica napus]
MVPSFVRPVMAQATRGFSRSVVSRRSFSSSAGKLFQHQISRAGTRGVGPYSNFFLI